MEQGEAVAYALNMLEERGVLFISPGDKLYEGMVIGENAKPQDLEVNPLKSKQLTNFRASGPKDESIRLTPPRRMTLEQAIAYIQDDELVEVTPKVIRIRKRHLDPHERKRQSRKSEAKANQREQTACAGRPAPGLDPGDRTDGTGFTPVTGTEARKSEAACT
jgi:GTP-binding protein